MELRRVTVTGADDSVDPAALIDLGNRFPLVEWGILLSRKQEGRPRFPSRDWIARLLETRAVAQLDGQPGGAIPLSGHLCGAWVRELCLGEMMFAMERPSYLTAFNRIQLNFHGEKHPYDAVGMSWVLKAWTRSHVGLTQVIFQFDGVNEHLMMIAAQSGIPSAPLYDLSGGAGIEPDEWPDGGAQTPWQGHVDAAGIVGYAGGLHPDRIEGQLAKISKAAGSVPFWIDIETHVRSDEDRKFDLDKVERFLSAVHSLSSSSSSSKNTGT